MSHPHQQAIEASISALKSAHDEISSLLGHEEIEGLKTRVLLNLEKQVHFLSAQVGAEYTTPTLKAEPLRKVLGRVINQQEVQSQHEQVEAIINKTPDEIAAEELSKKVTELYDKFSDIETPAILDTYDELEIRGVGKRAGLPVTEHTPKKVDARFVDSIKAAIKKKAELEEAGNQN